MPTHDPLTIVSFVLFSLLLFWDGVSLVGVGFRSHSQPVFQTHNASFFENKHDMSTPRAEDPVPFLVCLTVNCSYGHGGIVMDSCYGFSPSLPSKSPDIPLHQQTHNG